MLTISFALPFQTISGILMLVVLHTVVQDWSIDRHLLHLPFLPARFNQQFNPDHGKKDYQNRWKGA